MIFNATPYAAANAVAAIVAVIVAMVIWRRRYGQSGRSLTWLMCAAAVWSGFMAFEYAAVAIPVKILFAKLEYVGAVSVPVFFLLLAFEYNLSERRLKGRYVSLLFLIPALTLAAAWTNEWHHWLWTGFVPAAPGWNLLIYEHGPWFWFGMFGYSNALMLAGTVLLVRAYFLYPKPYRRLTLTLIVGSVIPWAGNLGYAAVLGPAIGYDPTPALITATGILISWSVLRLGYLDLLPVARGAAVENMSDALVVFDHLDRLVDLNPAARVLLADGGRSLVGLPAGEVLREWPAVLDALRDPAYPAAKTSRMVAGDLRHWMAHLSPLRDSRGQKMGSVLVMNDITVVEHAREAVQRSALMEERERIARDLHDNLGQVLAYMRMQTQTIQVYVTQGRTEQAAAQLERLSSVVGSAQAQLRATIVQLDPPLQAERRFAPNLAACIQKVTEDYGLHIDLKIAPVVSQRGFSQPVSTHLLNMIQEALTNAGKHSQAANVAISMVDLGDLAEVTIVDDGRGFDTSQPVDESIHFGLRFMYERAQQAGGTLTIDSAPGRGVCVVICVPLRLTSLDAETVQIPSEFLPGTR
jgi:signal transduction histidine kinase